MSSQEEIVKLLAQRLVHFIDTPKDRRKIVKAKEKWSYRWFGWLPLALKMVFKRRRKGGWMGGR